MSAGERRCWRNGLRPTPLSIVPAMPYVELERDDAGTVATLTLTNPGKQHAIPAAAWPAVEARRREVAVDTGVRCLVVTGAGDDFSSGADVSGRGEGPAGGRHHQLQQMRSVSAAVEALHAVPQPVVAR